jgi:hypothetical protein
MITLALLAAEVVGAQSKADRLRAYIGREPDGSAFVGYIIDTGTSDGPLEHGGPWANVDEALQWARDRAQEVVLTYGFTAGSVFSAGVVYTKGDTSQDALPTWPPDDHTLRAIDEAVARRITGEGLVSDEGLGVLESEER